MKHKSIRVIAVVLSALLIASMCTIAASAANAYDETVDNYYSVASKQDWDISPGVTESEIVLNNDTGTRRQVLHVMEADVSNEYTSVMTSYTGLQPNTYITPDKYDTSGMSKHAADIEQNFGYNVVGVMNCCLSWYNSAEYVKDPSRVNEPLGVMVVDGYTVFDHSVGFPTCLVIYKDERPEGTPKVEMKQITSANDLTGYEEQVIPTSSGFILVDGVVQGSENHSDAAARSVVGIKDDGTVVFVMNDGRQAPTSVGMSTYELAVMMKSLGCTYAVNCDGGGSSTFLSQRPGEDLKINCSPSEGVERPNTSGIVVVTSAPSNGEFVRAHVEADNDVVSPGSTVQFTALGTDLAGGAADIPAEATWALEDNSFGSIDNNGLFTSNGKTGEVTAQLVYQNEVKGSATVTVTTPDSISFEMENITVPFGKSVPLNITAMKGAKQVALKDGDIEYTLSNPAIGTISGSTFTAPAESEVTEATVTATFTGTEVSATANLTLGRGSEVVLDFEDGNENLFSCADMHGYHNVCSTYLVDKTTGKVHNGNYAQAMHVDFSETCDWGGVQGTNFYYQGEELDHTGATAIGFWMYIPEEAVGIYPAYRASVTDPNGSSVTFMPDNETKGFAGSCVEESGWKYIKIDMTGFAGDTIKNKTGYTMFQFYLQYVFNKPYDKSINTDVTFYVDDVTVDYSSAVDDREAPIFGTVSATANDIAATTVNMDRYATPTLNNGEVSFTAAVAEDTTKSNYTGINASSAKAYVDGVAVDGAYANGSIKTGNMKLASGVHTVKFSVEDAMGNYNCVVRKVNINSEDEASTISFVPHDPSITKALCSSLYYVDLVANKVETIDKVEAVIDLNNVNDWELNGMVVADGFSATYEVDEIDHVATIIINRDKNTDATGNAVLASLPIRVWGSEGWTYGNKTAEATGSKKWTPENEWSTKTLWPMDIKADVRYGKITYVDDYDSDVEGSFSGAQIVTNTEVYYSRLTSAGSTGIALFDSADWASKTRWHSHAEGTTLPKVEPTCTKPGYENRIVCEDCNSVIDWGTEIPATGHNYVVSDGKLVCSGCGEQYMINGIEKVGENYYYGVKGNLYRGWQLIDGDWHFYDSNTYAAVPTYNNGYVTYEFDETGKILADKWYTDSKGKKLFYGPGFYKGTTNADLWKEIDGDTYCFGLDGYVMTGYHYVRPGHSTAYRWYEFGNDGVLVGEWDYTGPYALGDNLYYIENGLSRHGMFEMDGDIYYAGSANYYAAIKNQSYYCRDNHKLMPDGTYTFGPDGKLLDNMFYTENGVLYYYVGGVKATDVGTVVINGEHVIVDETGKVIYTGYFTDVKGEELYYVDGVETHVVKNGVIDGYFYENDVKAPSYAGLKEYEGDFYYVDAGGKVITNTRKYVNKTNGLKFADGTDVQQTYYNFDADGKMVILNGIVDDYYYVNGAQAPAYYGLVKVDGDFYYVDAGGKIVKDARKYVNKSNDLTYDDGTPIPNTYFLFDEDGKMRVNDFILNDNAYIAGVKCGPYYGLVKIGDDFYYVDAGEKIIKNSRKYVNRPNGLKFADGTDVQQTYYEFDEDGKMIVKNGIIDDYYYINGAQAPAYYGLVEFEGNFYYVNDYGRIIKDARKFVNKTNGLKFADGTDVPRAYFNFDADGKMVID